MKRHALGYKQDEPDERDLLSEMLLGAPMRADVVVPASMKKYRGAPIRQGRASSCVAHALYRTLDMCLRYELEKADKSGVLPPGASRRFMYFNARNQENVDAKAAGKTLHAVRDEGSFPRLAMRAVQKLGFCDEDLFPYSDDAKAINEPPPPTAFQGAYDQSNFRYYRVASTGTARVAEVARALAQGKPVLFGMFVDTDFMANVGQTLTRINAADPDGGGHMLAVLEVTSDTVVFDNWWGEDWGADGIGKMSHALFGGVNISDVYVIEAAPTFSSDALENA